jgi:hypothetical protein
MGVFGQLSRIRKDFCLPFSPAEMLLMLLKLIAKNRTNFQH